MIDHNELLFVVDENNQPVEAKPRSEVHKKGYWHRTSHIWIVNDHGQILVQKRSMLKDSNPGKWESFFGGHLEPGVEYVEGAIREVREELGLDLHKDDLTFFEIYKAERSHEFQGIFVYHWNGNIHNIEYETEEIDHIEWFNRDDLYEIFVIQHNPDWAKMGYEKEILEHLASNK